jgi:hypothetical protein
MSDFISFQTLLSESKHIRRLAKKHNGSLQEAVLTAKKRNSLKPKQFAIIDSTGKGRLPINDATHIKAAATYGIARVKGLSPAEKAKAAMKIKAAAAKHGINTPALQNYKQEK